jgi:hypothetical protein
MRKILLTVAIFFVTASFLWASDEASNDARATADGEGDAEYVIREEKVVNFETGKVEVEKVIEFPELEILPELTRPVEIIIPRTKPNFDKMPLTIYNNEPSYHLPVEYRSRYYRLAPVGDVNTGDMYKVPDSEEGSETAEPGTGD